MILLYLSVCWHRRQTEIPHPLMPVVLRTMPLAAPLDEMLINSKWLEPMIVLATLSAVGVVVVSVLAVSVTLTVPPAPGDGERKNEISQLSGPSRQEDANAQGRIEDARSDKETARVLKDSLTEIKNDPTEKRTELIHAFPSAQSSCGGMQRPTNSLLSSQR